MPAKLAKWQIDNAALAVNKMLVKAGVDGVPEDEVKKKIQDTLKLNEFPKSDFGKILFTARTEKKGDRYYFYDGTGPRPRKVKDSKTTPILPMPTSANELNFCQGGYEVDVQGPDASIHIKGAKSVTIKV